MIPLPAPGWVNFPAKTWVNFSRGIDTLHFP
jgi:hypothetical protein